MRSLDRPAARPALAGRRVLVVACGRNLAALTESLGAAGAEATIGLSADARGGPVDVVLWDGDDDRDAIRTLRREGFAGLVFVLTGDESPAAATAYARAGADDVLPAWCDVDDLIARLADALLRAENAAAVSAGPFGAS